MAKSLSVVEAAKALGISLDATFRLVKVGKLRGRKLKSGQWSITPAAITERKRDKARRVAKHRKAA